MMLALNGVDGIIRMFNNNAFMEMHDDRIVFGINGGGSVTIDENGVTVIGTTFWACTSKGALGFEGATVDAAQVPAGKIGIGPGNATQDSDSWSIPIPKPNP
jgi:hypothetical protein